MGWPALAGVRGNGRKTKAAACAVKRFCRSKGRPSRRGTALPHWPSRFDLRGTRVSSLRLSTPFCIGKFRDKKIRKRPNLCRSSLVGGGNKIQATFRQSPIGHDGFEL